MVRTKVLDESIEQEVDSLGLFDKAHRKQILV
jgi:hypothetical protein